VVGYVVRGINWGLGSASVLRYFGLCVLRLRIVGLICGNAVVELIQENAEGIEEVLAVDVVEVMVKFSFILYLPVSSCREKPWSRE
jgi:hypothetical protein